MHWCCSYRTHTRSHLSQATVDEVVPQFGLAYFVDHQDGQWTVTRQTPGLGLDGLVPGQHVYLTLANDENLTWVRHYRTVP